MNPLKQNSVSILFIFILSFFTRTGYSQESTPQPEQIIKFSGYVKNDAILDTRQTVAAREGNFLLFPAQKLLDSLDEDINARPNFNILAIEARLTANITGPNAFGAKTSGVLEGDFFGQLNANINLLRLRHAYVKLQWEKFELLCGQYWHPLFVTSCYPTTVSFNTGAPIQPFSRAPQIKGTFVLGDLKLSAIAVSQRDYASVGPDGNDSKYMRNSGFPPELQFQWELGIKGNPEFTMGSGVGYKQLMPQIKTYRNYKSEEQVSGLSVNGFFKFKSKAVTIKLSGVYLENGSEYLCISGYAAQDTVDVTKGIISYAPVRTLCLWNDIQTNGSKLQIGLFYGYTKNLGTKEEVDGPVYLTLNANIRDLFRISPRVLYTSGKTTFALEFEYTSASYGSLNEKAVPVNTTRADNLRAVFSTIYKF